MSRWYTTIIADTAAGAAGCKYQKCCFTFCEIEDDQTMQSKEHCCRHFKIGFELLKKEEQN